MTFILETPIIIYNLCSLQNDMQFTSNQSKHTVYECVVLVKSVVFIGDVKLQYIALATALDF